MSTDVPPLTLDEHPARKELPGPLAHFMPLVEDGLLRGMMPEQLVALEPADVLGFGNGALRRVRRRRLWLVQEIELGRFFGHTSVSH